MDKSLANRIASECLSKFDSLPKTGKPNEDFEWTILAAIALVVRATTPSEPSVRVVALGSGTKCLGGSELSPRGDLVNDSHAEVLARRAFLRYLLEQIEAAVGDGKDGSIFERSYESDELKFVLKKGHSFHFFTTHSPCGDASIFERSDGVSKGDEDEGPQVKRCRMDIPIALEKESFGSVVMVSGEAGNPSIVVGGKTGGKLLQTEADGDLMAQTIGAVRTKPGRGIRTLSVSCSDKMARWSVLGLQGALLMLLLEKPIYLESLIICDGTDHSVDALQRAIWGRFDRSLAEETGTIIEQPYRRCIPELIAATNGRLFRFRKNRNVASDTRKYQPSPCGIIWCDVTERPHEVEVGGRRHGVTKRKLGTPAARLRISKIELFVRFARLYRICREAKLLAGQTLNNLAPDKEPEIMIRNTADSVPSAVDDDAAKSEGHPKLKQNRTDDVAKLSYATAKARSVGYVQQWVRLRDVAFEGKWTVKPDSLGQFHMDISTSSA
ncbi:tRNA-specific adenosine deaminase 1 [Anopheles ziemanni]|uniref:tRNA-specific adenosine deaminase 1 n=1 Tax=Anopheles coustani TaxID=139045 RepID=UPI00265A09EE|nr:tRNA-specific adenosine deaminase 1 [Anopheles coustani]XP_058178905.1 tRNA-specific adenosine deaminase 1 [Anopheles ziemanni]